MIEEQNNIETKRQKAFLRRLTDAKERLQTAIDGLGQKTLCSEYVMGDWTIKDILGHMVSWNEEFRANIAMILRDEHPGYEYEISGKDDFNAWSQKLIAQKRNWTLDRILSHLERDYQEAVGLIMILEASDFKKRGVTPWKDAALKKPVLLTKEDTDSVETLVTFHWRHMNQHILDIEKWRQQRHLPLPDKLDDNLNVL